MKKLLSLVLAVVMVLGLVACGGNGGSETTAPVETTTPAVEGTYTYNYALAEFPTNWNYHTYQTNIDAEILDYISSSFYVFDYNETKDGYAMVDGMAVGDPVDVTAEYVGQYGIVEGDTARAYVLNLRQDLKWQDGTPITANDFVESAKRLLNPEAQNYRADVMYAGSVQIHNAEAYLKQGQVNMTENNLAPTRYLVADLVKAEDGTYTTPDGIPMYIATGFALTDWLGGNTLQYYVEGYGDAMFDVESFNALAAMANEEGLVAATDETIDLLTKVITFSADWGESADNIPDYLVYEVTYPEVAWENVGWFAKSDYELVFVMDAPLDGFYLKYNLPAPLVNIEMYDACASVVDGVYTNTYCTSAETTMSYGPYKLTSYQADKQYVLEKNEYFYDLSEDTYQATSIVVDCVKEPATRLELFLQGKLDTFGLTKDYMDEYQMSDYTYYATGDSTFAMVFNPDAEALEIGRAHV